MGRPCDYTEELAQKICSKLAEGISLRTVCLADDMPNKSTVFKWLAEIEGFSDQYVRAKEESADAMHEELMILGDEAIRLSQEVDFKASNAVVSAVKLKADNMKWSMSKMKPKKYGDKLDLTSKGKELPQPIYGGLSKANKLDGEVSGHNSNEEDISTE